MNNIISNQYESPQIMIVTVEVEKGFAASDDQLVGTIPEMNFGGNF